MPFVLTHFYFVIADAGASESGILVLNQRPEFLPHTCTSVASRLIRRLARIRPAPRMKAINHCGVVGYNLGST